MTEMLTTEAPRNHAFAELGTNVVGLDKAVDVLEAAGMARWNVRKVPLTLPSGELVPDRWATVRDIEATGAMGYLGTVGRTYTPFQNEMAADTLDALTDDGGAHYARAGYLGAGNKTFVTMQLPESMTLTGKNGEEDRTDWYLVAFNSHDGSSAFHFAVTGIRVFCANQETAVLAEAKSSFAIRHTKNSTGTLQEIREALKLTYRYVDAFEDQVAALYAEEMAIAEAEKFVSDLFKVEEAATEKARAGRAENARQVLDVFSTSPTLAPIAGTRWAAYNAVTEWADHLRPMAGQIDSAKARNDRALRSIGSAQVHNLKTAAFQLLQPA